MRTGRKQLCKTENAEQENLRPNHANPLAPEVPISDTIRYRASFQVDYNELSKSKGKCTGERGESCDTVQAHGAGAASTKENQSAYECAGVLG